MEIVSWIAVGITVLLGAALVIALHGWHRVAKARDFQTRRITTYVRINSDLTLKLAREEGKVADLTAQNLQWAKRFRDLAYEHATGGQTLKAKHR